MCFAGCWLLVVEGCLMFSCMLFVVRCLLFVDVCCCVSFVDVSCCLVFVVWCLLFVDVC